MSGQVTLTSTTAASIVTTTEILEPVVPIQCRRTILYCNPLATTLPTTTLPIPQSTAAPVNFPFPTFSTTVQSNFPLSKSTAVAVQDLAQLQTAGKSLPEWKLEQYNGYPVQWHEWIGQFRSAINCAPLSNDVKPTYLKMLVTGKARTPIAEFAYCGTMYQEVPNSLERKVCQPYAVVSVHLDKLSGFPPSKMYNGGNVIAFVETILALAGVFRSSNTSTTCRVRHFWDKQDTNFPEHEGRLICAHCQERSEPTNLLEFQQLLERES